jgi:acetate kinase
VPDLRVDVLGHRFVHGGRRFAEPVLITPELEDELFTLIQLEPGHLEPDVRLARAMAELFPRVAGVACFDTAFHRTMPAVAQMHPLPRELFDQGVVRFGSHGLSLEYIMSRLAADSGANAAHERVVIAHLGCTASMTAVRHGASVDTTAGYMPNGGLMMATRSGDLSPGVLLHLLIGKDMPALDVNRMVNFQSGLLGVSRVSRDMQELLKSADTNPHAAEAVALFCYTARKHLGSLAAVLGGLDTLVFTGGIGANAPAVRRGICEQMEHLGIRLEAGRNRQNGAVISPEGSPVTVRVVPANEELVVARAAARVASESLFKD